MSSCFTTGSAAPAQHAQRSGTGGCRIGHTPVKRTTNMLSKISAALLVAALAGTPALAAPAPSHAAAPTQHHAKAHVTKITSARHVKHVRYTLHVKHKGHLRHVAAVHGRNSHATT